MKKSLFAVLAILTLLTGCFKSENTNTVSTDGSTSMEKVIGILGEVFTENNKGVNFTYNPTGSGTGISSVLENRCDIGLSSRNLKQSEIEKGLTETILAYDGIAIIVNKENPISNLQLETLEKIFTVVITNWKELGGSDSEIVLIGREAGSGTRDGFESTTKTSGKCKYRQELTSTGDVIATVSGNPFAIGYASVASVKDSVKLLSINNVLPSNQTIKSGSYEIQRPFVMVTKKNVPLSKWAQEFFEVEKISFGTFWRATTKIVHCKSLGDKTKNPFDG